MSARATKQELTIPKRETLKLSQEGKTSKHAFSVW
jgi:hypothetical protein